jgi:hypothetical protein
MYSFVFPMDSNRLEQFKVTKEKYDDMDFVKEFVIPTREKEAVAKYLEENNLDKDVRLITYVVEEGFNPSKAFNIGVRKAKYDNIIITSPEVKPSTDVLEQLSHLLDKNVICEAWDEWQFGDLHLLVNSSYKNESPFMYFLAMFRKEDIQKINGWDEEFMKGYAWEDNDFGERWNRAGIPFEIHDEIKALHQYHPRTETIINGMATNQQHFYLNNDDKIIYCKNGLIKDN